MSVRGARLGVTVAAQDIYEASTTQKHRIGERLPLGDRVFRYCKAGAAIADPYTRQGCINYHQPYEGNRAATAYAVGATEITLPTVGSTIDTGLTAADAYAEGYIWFQTDPSQMHRIRSNTVSDGTNIVVTLYDGLTTALPTGTAGTTRWVTMWPSIYSDVRQGNAEASGFSSVVCLPLIEVASGSYFWGQTWGPAFFTAFSTAPGKTAGYRGVHFNTTDKSVIDAGGGTIGLQYAGYLLARTTSTYGDQFVMLQLSP
jgi:hypothetical protein